MAGACVIQQRDGAWFTLEAKRTAEASGKELRGPHDRNRLRPGYV